MLRLAFVESSSSLSRSALNRCFKRHGINRLSDIRGDRSIREKPALNPAQQQTGYFQLEVVEACCEAKQIYLFIGIGVDRSSRVAYAVPGSLGNISRNYFENGKLMTSSDLVFDYKAYRRITPNEYTKSFMPFLDAQVLLPEFELRKDLFRLANAKIEAERIVILERLVYYPECRFDFDKLVREYVTNAKTQKSLLKKRKKWDEHG